MDAVEPFVALVIYPTTAEAQSGQAATLLAAKLRPKAYWLRLHPAVEVP
jgi:hypothetical protein